MNPNFRWHYVRRYLISFSTSKIKMPKTDNKKIYCFDLKGFENGTLYFQVTQPWLNLTLLYLSLIEWFLNVTKKLKNRHFQLISLLSLFRKKVSIWRIRYVSEIPNKNNPFMAKMFRTFILRHIKVRFPL